MCGRLGAMIANTDRDIDSGAIETGTVADLLRAIESVQVAPRVCQVAQPAPPVTPARVAVARVAVCQK
jgi:hypothetical protein